MADEANMTGKKTALQRAAAIFSAPRKTLSLGLVAKARPFVAVGLLLAVSAGAFMNNAAADSIGVDIGPTPAQIVVQANEADLKASGGGSLLDMGREILAKTVKSAPVEADNSIEDIEIEGDSFTYMHETAVENLPDAAAVKDYLEAKKASGNNAARISLREVMLDLIPQSDNRIASYLDGTVQIKGVKLDKKISLSKPSSEKKIIEAVEEYKGAAEVVAAIQNAATVTGVDFDYLYAKAGMESRFDPKVRAHGNVTTATGLYQFINKTWLGMVKNHGAEHGIEPRLVEAAQMNYNKLRKADKKIFNEILELRKDAKISALMGAEFALENQNYLKSQRHKNIGPAELYMAHFLGAGGANLFLKRLKRNSHTFGASVFPKAAKANPGRFYSGNGRPLTLKQIHKSAGADIAWYNKVKDKGVDAYSTAHFTMPIPTVKPKIAGETEVAILDISKYPTPNKPK